MGFGEHLLRREGRLVRDIARERWTWQARFEEIVTPLESMGVVESTRNCLNLGMMRAYIYEKTTA